MPIMSGAASTIGIVPTRIFVSDCPPLRADRADAPSAAPRPVRNVRRDRSIKASSLLQFGGLRPTVVKRSDGSLLWRVPEDQPPFNRNKRRIQHRTQRGD